MAVYYLDTSALVKRYALEPGSNWVIGLADPVARHDLYTVRLTGPEMIAALFRKARTGIVEVSASLADRAMSLAEEHGLRGYDAVHLAAALELQDRRRAMQLPLLTFVSADDDQLRAAAAEGCPKENPNWHP